MEIKVLSEEKNKLTIELLEQGHTLCNALKEALYEDSNVVSAGYMLEHPQVSKPKMVIETKGSSPREALVKAAELLKKQNKEFLASAKKAL